jgi:hypothetical protein
MKWIALTILLWVVACLIIYWFNYGAHKDGTDEDSQ